MGMEKAETPVADSVAGMIKVVRDERNIVAYVQAN